VTPITAACMLAAGCVAVWFVLTPHRRQAKKVLRVVESAVMLHMTVVYTIATIMRPVPLIIKNGTLGQIGVIALGLVIIAEIVVDSNLCLRKR
jgi:hypothetical protein